MFKIKYSGRTDQTRYFNELNESLTATDVKKISSTWCETYKSNGNKLLLFCTFSWPGLFCVSMHKNMISGFETLKLHWSIDRRSFTLSGVSSCAWGTFYIAFFKMLLEMKVFSVCCMLWLVWECLVYSVSQDHSIKSLSQLCSYVPSRLQGNGIFKVSMWGRYFTEKYSLLNGPHNWDRRADFQLTFSFPPSYYLTVDCMERWDSMEKCRITVSHGRRQNPKLV